MHCQMWSDSNVSDRPKLADQVTCLNVRLILKAVILRTLAIDEHRFVVSLLQASLIVWTWVSSVRKHVILVTLRTTPIRPRVIDSNLPWAITGTQSTRCKASVFSDEKGVR